MMCNELTYHGMEMFYFRQLRVYQDAKQLAINTNQALRRFPADERFALTDQLRRASSSVMFNIAEAFGLYSAKERIRFLDIANGSAMETASELELAEAYGYISEAERKEFDQQIVGIVKQLSSLRSSLSDKI